MSIDTLFHLVNDKVDFLSVWGVDFPWNSFHNALNYLREREFIEDNVMTNEIKFTCMGKVLSTILPHPWNKLPLDLRVHIWRHYLACFERRSIYTAVTGKGWKDMTDCAVHCGNVDAAIFKAVNLLNETFTRTNYM